MPSSDDTLKVLLGDIEERTISRKGIEFYYLFYNSDRLQTLRDRYEANDFRRSNKIRSKEKAKFKYNRNDISVIHVFDPQTREYLAVPAINQNYTQNLSLAQHKIIYRYALKTRKNSKARKKSAANKSKLQQENKRNATASKKQKDSLKEKQHITDKVTQTESSTKEKYEQQPKQEKKSRGTIGLPQWKPPSR